ncbi:Spy/CpxP family protein refolding chaperone [Ramlibacter sp. H39-3-26]|uniref:Spy/CpxP family protein refolding chaperone n=1 Tax=Curvibacter soli TaxID=3031331 RepID=UPI0023DA9A3E|nr:Spy/CpxP family protein refolding chaperone [Ramlibacter sp. H39-3-26]MDF1485654.1 Spy/CpxP family protein refolding chaperone [Ramlibacter sp. H39-3-26]
MKPLQQRLAIATLLAAMGGTAAFAQPANTDAPKGPPPAGHMRHDMRHGDPAKTEAFMARREAALKEKLQITASQEGAWTAFTTAMKPSTRPEPPARDEFDKLTTPERIDRLRALRSEHQAQMDQRMDAVKTFYAVLSPAQQKTFDAEFRHFDAPRRHGNRPDGKSPMPHNN